MRIDTHTTWKRSDAEFAAFPLGLDVAVNDIEGGSEALVTATPETWHELLPRLEEIEGVRVLLNMEFHPLDR